MHHSKVIMQKILAELNVEFYKLLAYFVSISPAQHDSMGSSSLLLLAGFHNHLLPWDIVSESLVDWHFWRSCSPRYIKVLGVNKSQHAYGPVWHACLRLTSAQVILETSQLLSVPEKEMDSPTLRCTTVIEPSLIKCFFLVNIWVQGAETYGQH